MQKPFNPTATRALVALFATLSLAACVAPAGPNCGPGEQAMVSETLYFGSATPHGQLTADQWAAFVRDEVTPRFPDGLTVWPAQGQWRRDDGTVVREASWVLNIVHPDSAGAAAKLAEIIAAYKGRYRQEAVLRSHSPVCVSF